MIKIKQILENDNVILIISFTVVMLMGYLNVSSNNHNIKTLILQLLGQFFVLAWQWSRYKINTMKQMERLKDILRGHSIDRNF
jgi:hypothetical protein